MKVIKVKINKLYGLPLKIFGMANWREGDSILTVHVYTGEPPMFWKVYEVPIEDCSLMNNIPRYP